MFRTPLAVLIAATAAAIFAAPTPAAGAPGTLNGPPTTGERIFLAAPASYPADTPFYILVGYADGSLSPVDNWGEEMQFVTAEGLMSGLTHVDLLVDGEQVAGIEDLGFLDPSTSSDPVRKGYLYDFRDGLPAGTHTFVADYYWLGELIATRTAAVPFT